MPAIRRHQFRKSRSDPCLDYIRTPLHESLPPLRPAPHSGRRSTIPNVVPSDNTGATTKVSTGTQTDLSARRLKNIADGCLVDSLAFAKFITGKRVSAYNGQGEGQGPEESALEPRGSSAENLSVALSERFIRWDMGPVPIMQNPRLTQLVARQARAALENGEIVLQDVRSDKVESGADGAVPFSATERVETTAASALTASPDELPHIVQEVLKFHREMGIADPKDQKVSNFELFAGGTKLPQDQHSRIAELVVDGVLSEANDLTKETSLLMGSPMSNRASTEGSPQAAPDEVYEGYLTQQIMKKQSFLEQMHLDVLGERPEEDRPADSQQDLFLSIMSGVCKTCGKKLKHMELTDLFRYKLLHKDEPFVFDSEHFCCEDFQKELEKLLFSRGVKDAVRDIRQSQVMSQKSSRKQKSKGSHSHKEGHGPKRSHNQSGREDSSDLSELDTLAQLLDEESKSSSSSSSEEEGADDNESSSGRKSVAKGLRGNFKSRLKSTLSGRFKGSSAIGTKSVVGGATGAAGATSARGAKRRSSMIKGADSDVGLIGSTTAQKFNQRKDSILSQKRSSVTDARRASYSRNWKSTPEESDTRYKGNSINWSLSSRICMKTGWTLQRPRSSEISQSQGLYLTERLLEVEEDHATINKPVKHWPLFPACFVHWPGDATVGPYTEPPSPTDFYPYLDGGTACVTAEYAPGLSILVVLPKPVRSPAGARPPCPVAAIFDTSSWGAVIDTDWTPNVLLSPKDVKFCGSAADLPKDKEKTVSWKSLAQNIANPHLKSVQGFNDEAEMDIRGRGEIVFTLKNEAMKVEMNCGFRQKKAAYTSASEDGAKNFLAALESRRQEVLKNINSLQKLLTEANRIEESVAAASDHRSKHHQPHHKTTRTNLARDPAISVR
ncbi:hypothetical protein BV898_06539 [Hypsibius exemplaris]|uniref:Uncharacterized protein n=1 Tax=Hypsibius exemplaris TaxID=2072580 RepID=A0A1W0WW46_HYPEX|nr:hypothetical protein BV898_06539 [Hypsibius exemplaris]